MVFVDDGVVPPAKTYLRPETPQDAPAFRFSVKSPK